MGKDGHHFGSLPVPVAPVGFTFILGKITEFPVGGNWHNKNNWLPPKHLLPMCVVVNIDKLWYYCFWKCIAIVSDLGPWTILLILFIIIMHLFRRILTGGTHRITVNLTTEFMSSINVFNRGLRWVWLVLFYYLQFIFTFYYCAQGQFQLRLEIFKCCNLKFFFFF